MLPKRPPLNFASVEVDAVPEEYIISPSDVYNALICINVHKTPGPEEIHNCTAKNPFLISRKKKLVSRIIFLKQEFFY